MHNLTSFNTPAISFWHVSHWNRDHNRHMRYVSNQRLILGWYEWQLSDKIVIRSKSRPDINMVALSCFDDKTISVVEMRIRLSAEVLARPGGQRDRDDGGISVRFTSATGGPGPSSSWSFSAQCVWLHVRDPTKTTWK